MSLEGKTAPAFELEGSDGRKHTLAEYAGSTVIIYFYPRDNTPGCTKEACGFRDLSPALGELNAVVLGVSKDSLKSHDKFIKDFGLPFLLLSDPDAVMMTAYGAFGKKVMYGKEMEGIIRSTLLIDPKGIVRKAWPKVSVKGHVQEVLAALESLGC